MTPAAFMAALRKTRDPNWSDVQHLLDLVWSGDVIARPADTHASNAALSGLHSIPEDDDE